jgi:hypothetical protein
MAFRYVNKKGQVYWLHSKFVTLKSTKKPQETFFFSKEAEDAIDLPANYEVVESPRTGLPLLKKIRTINT